MSVENTKTNVMAQDNPELSKVLNELGMDMINNPFFQMIAQAMGALNSGAAFREPSANVAAGFDGRCTLEYSYNEVFEGAEEKFARVIAEKLDDYTFKALLTKGPVECTIMFTFRDTTFVFNWDNEIKHFVGVKDGDVEYEHVYNEMKAEFVLKDEYLKSLNTVTVEEDEVEVVPEMSDVEKEAEAVYEETCTPVEEVPCTVTAKCDTSFADRLYEKLNGKFQDDVFNKFKGDLIVAFHRIFDYEMYETGFNDNHSEIDKVKFTLEDVLKVCPSEKVGKFWDTISSQKIVGLIADEFKFRSVMTYLDPANGTHCVVCHLK
jgi:hypothetical protein